MEKIELTEDIFLVENFFTEKECQDFITWSEYHGYEEAKVQMSGQQIMMKNLRNNSRIMFEDTQLAQTVWERIKPFCISQIEISTAVGVNEMFRFYKYEVGQKFKRHIDGSYQRNTQERSFYTLLIYLNDDFEGGETAFDNHTVKPSTGCALIFKHQLKHEGKELIKGIKYVLRTDIMYRIE